VCLHVFHSYLCVEAATWQLLCKFKKGPLSPTSHFLCPSKRCLPLATMAASPAPTRFVAPEEYDMTPSGAPVEDAAAGLPADLTPGSEAGFNGSGSKRAASSAEGPLAAAPAKKKSKMVSCYRDVNLGGWTTKVKGKNNYGSPTILIFGEDGAPRMALFHREEPRCIFPFKLDLEPANGAQVPSFLSGKPDPNKTTEGLDIQITLTPEQAAFLGRVDEWAQQQAVLNSKEWFGRSYTATEIAAMYTPALKKDKEERYPPKLKSKIVLSGVSDYLTKVIYIASDGTRRTGAGWDFVKPLLGSNCWRGNEVRAVVEFRRVWVVGKKFGLIGNYTDLVVVEKEKGPSDVDFPELDLA